VVVGAAVVTVVGEGVIDEGSGGRLDWVTGKRTPGVATGTSEETELARVEAAGDACEDAPSWVNTATGPATSRAAVKDQRTRSHPGKGAFMARKPTTRLWTNSPVGLWPVTVGTTHNDGMRHLRSHARTSAYPPESAASEVEASHWGYPGPCPECDSMGFLDHVDLVNRIMREHCPHCRASWEVREADCDSAG
jgi:hypothetical protein